MCTARHQGEQPGLVSWERLGYDGRRLINRGQIGFVTAKATTTDTPGSAFEDTDLL